MIDPQVPVTRGRARSHRLAIMLAAASSIAAVVAVGCHADENDPAGQAGELSDPVRRRNAITNIHRLYGSALAAANGDRNAAPVRAIVDATVERLTATYVEHPEDVANGEMILETLVEMRDPRSLPALTKALHWRVEITEEHATRAARTLQNMEGLSEEQKGEAVAALTDALNLITQNRAIDNRMRVEFFRALSALRDRRATEVLTRIVRTQSESQPFVANIVAARTLGGLEDPTAVATLIWALYAFDPNNPMMRMNDVASQALVHIGRPALEPLLATLRGENEEANAEAARYIEAVRQRDAQAAAQMDANLVVATEAMYALGQLGFREAIDPLLAQTNQLDAGEAETSTESDPKDAARMMSAAIALVSINREEGDTARIREALQRVFRRVELVSRLQLLVGMQHFMDPGLLPFLLEQARPPRNREDEIPDLRVLAFRAYAFLATNDEMAALRQMLAAEPEGDSRTAFNEFQPVLDAAAQCSGGSGAGNSDLACWQGKLSDSNNLVAAKAAYMVARLGRGNDAAVAALAAEVDHADAMTRGEILYALDYAATRGSPDAVRIIEDLGEREEGRSIWTRTGPIARAVEARLEARAAH